MINKHSNYVKFSIENPSFLGVICLVISILGIVGAYSMPVDLYQNAWLH